MSPVYIRRGILTRFWCPGCDDLHQVSDSWEVDDADGTLTISPSVLVYEHKKFVNDDLDWDKLCEPENITWSPRCHSFVRGGRIEFLTDSTHELAGQTVDLPELPEWLVRETP